MQHKSTSNLFLCVVLMSLYEVCYKSRWWWHSTMNCYLNRGYISFSALTHSLSLFKLRLACLVFQELIHLANRQHAMVMVCSSEMFKTNTHTKKTTMHAFQEVCAWVSLNTLTCKIQYGKANQLSIAYSLGKPHS